MIGNAEVRIAIERDAERVNPILSENHLVDAAQIAAKMVAQQLLDCSLREGNLILTFD